jgi:hypothetical protein
LSSLLTMVHAVSRIRLWSATGNFSFLPPSRRRLDHAVEHFPAK